MMNSNLHKEYLTYLFYLEVLMMALNFHENLSHINVFLNLMSLIDDVYLQIFNLITFFIQLLNVLLISYLYFLKTVIIIQYH